MTVARRFRALIALLAAGLLLAGCGALPADTAASTAGFSTPAMGSPAPVEQSTAPTAAKELGVELQIHDSSPKTLAVRGDGTITLTDGDHSESATVAPPALEGLQRAIDEGGFMSLAEKYPGSDCCDFIAHTITVRTGAEQHTVYCYNECPAEFDRVKEAILQLWPAEIEYRGWA